MTWFPDLADKIDPGDGLPEVDTLPAFVRQMTAPGHFH
jgi:hypothetical protein